LFDGWIETRSLGGANWEGPEKTCAGSGLRFTRAKRSLANSPEFGSIFPMPLYEYTCEDCQERSELLIMGETEPVCPRCGSKRLHKEFSTFAAHGGDTRAAGAGAAHSHSPGCGCCMGPQGACGLN
jgi:putative FmdB family regulatory protein